MYDPVSRFHSIECRYCGQVFKIRFGRRRYCSDQCYIKAHPRKPRRYHLWTYQEDHLLRELAGKVPVREIAARLGRKHASVLTRAARLKTRCKLYGERSHLAKHGDALVEHARSLYYDDGIGVTAIAKQLSLSIHTINNYVHYRTNLGPPIEYYF